MDIAYLNGSFLPKEEIRISPDDRGFLFGDGVYEVMKWYAGFFFDPASHLDRLKRSLRETRITWPGADEFLSLSNELIRLNNLGSRHALVYLQVTRGASPRNHSFPDPPVNPTIYAFARETAQLTPDAGAGVSVLLAPDIRWSRCDIKSVALLANTLSFQKAHEKGHSECIFVRDGFITEGSRSNIFFVKDGCLHTHPESGNILSGVTRKNVLRFARQKGIPVREEPIHEKDLNLIAEAFITNTSAEVKPVTSIGSTTVGDGKPGPVTLKLREMFRLELEALKG